MDRPVALAAASSSFSTSILWLLKDWFLRDIGFSPPIDLAAAVGGVDLSCPEPSAIPFTFWTGLALGFCLWPAIEILVLCKQWVTLVLRSRIASVGVQGKLYRVLS